PIQGHGQARRMPVTRNAPFSLVFSAIRKENYQYVFRGKVAKKGEIAGVLGWLSGVVVCGS
ncbi:hypothetical protein, partial [Paramuribaculum intestinale]|uniref:hypothetical protein n=1 Tax=Paramuribaculum intestinale TaxID=2094151 RepID=UPI0025A9D976